MGDNRVEQNISLSQKMAQASQVVPRSTSELGDNLELQQDEGVYVFSDYRLDGPERRLSHACVPIPLPPKAFDLLLVLVQHAGQLVEKEYLLRTVWPDSFVVEANISVYVSTLRKVFAKSSPTHEFIETIPKWGYRFTSSVTRHTFAQMRSLSDGLTDNVPPVPESQEPHFQGLSAAVHPVVKPEFKWQGTRLVWLMILLFAACTVSAMVLLIPKFPIKTNGISANTHPLISLPGFFSQPAFSADGQKLAYAWKASGDPYQSIYFQSVTSDERIRLTDTGGDDFSPVWSPKNPEIAFLHSVGDALQIVIVNTQTPALRRNLTTISGVEPSFRIPPSLAWSPDNESILTTDAEIPGQSPSLTLISVASGKKHALTHAPPRMVDDDGAFSPDGKMVAFRREMGDSFDQVYVIPAKGGKERRLAFQPGPIDGLAWSPDGQSVILSSSRATSVGNIWRVPLNGGVAVALTTPLAHTSSPAVSTTAHRLAYVNAPNNVSIWRLPIEGKGEAEQFIASNFFDSSPRYSPDGTHIAFRSDRSGTNEIWICRSDGKDPRRVTHFNGPMTGSPQWSPDSKSLAFDSRVTGRADIYIVDISSGAPTRITNGISNSSDNVVPSWSQDGRSLYFSSNRTGEWQIWRKSLDDGAETQVTTNGGFNGMQSQDSSYLYYVRDLSIMDIWRLSLHNGKEEQVLPALNPGMWGSWTIEKNKLFYMRRRRSIGEPADILRRDLATGSTKIIGQAKNVVNGGISISPDGRWMTFAQNNGNRNSTIMIMDGWD